MIHSEGTLAKLPVGVPYIFAKERAKQLIKRTP